MLSNVEVASSPAPTALKEDSVAFIIQLMQQRDLKTVLELGGGLGLTATRLAAAGAFVTTVERNATYAAAIRERAARRGVDAQVHVVSADALSPSLAVAGFFDLILIDAAKAQYTRLFQRYSPQLASAGVIISDNMAFHGITHDSSLTHSRSTKCLAKHLRDYASFLRFHPDFATHYVDAGDTLAVSEHKGNFEPLLRDDQLLFCANDVRYFALLHEGRCCTLKVMPSGASWDQVCSQARLLDTLHSSHVAALTPIGIVRVGEGFALQVSEQPAMTLGCALQQAHTADTQSYLVKQLVALQRQTDQLAGVAMRSYKDELRTLAGGNTKETAPVIRAIKRLPDGGGATIICATLDELVVLQDGTVCFAGECCLCQAPFELAACVTWLQLDREVSTTAAHLYLAAVGMCEEQLSPFADVLRALPQLSSCAV